MMPIQDSADLPPSPLQIERAKFIPPVPPVLRDLASVKMTCAQALAPLSSELKSSFPDLDGSSTREASLQSASCNLGTTALARPLKVALLLSGGAAPGGHNVVAGLYDALIEIDPRNQLIGFLDGYLGLLENRFRPISQELLSNYRQMGGFDLLGSGRLRVHEPHQLAQCRAVIAKHQLDGLVIVGGDDSNTNATIIAQDIAASGSSCAVIGVPKTIDGDLKNRWIEQSFGHDTACRVYSELISSIARDCLSSKKYYHFIRLMGRSASHIALECALQTHPTWVLIAEELGRQPDLTLQDIADSLAQLIRARRQKGLDHGVILIPEGLLEFLPQMRELFSRIEEVQSRGVKTPEELLESLGERGAIYRDLPRDIQCQLLLERDPHGHIQISRLETEKMLIQLVQKNLEQTGQELSALPHFFGYEARAAMPSDFDATYTYTLGRLSSLLIREGLNGFMAVIQNLAYPTDQWKPIGVPLVQMLGYEEDSSSRRPVMARSQVDLQSPSFHYLLVHRAQWAERDRFRLVGPMQYFGPASVHSNGPLALRLDHGLSIEGII